VKAPPGVTLRRHRSRRPPPGRPGAGHALRRVAHAGPDPGRQVFLKFENLQFTASFKERGALNKLATLVEAGVPIRGVIAASAGNHAQGVAHHAQRLGLRAVIVMPRTTPTVKVERTRGFGAEVVLHGDSFDEAREQALALAAAQGLTFVHPFDDPP
jgi:threonine dehydratase